MATIVIDDGGNDQCTDADKPKVGKSAAWVTQIESETGTVREPTYQSCPEGGLQERPNKMQKVDETTKHTPALHFSGSRLYATTASAAEAAVTSLLVALDQQKRHDVNQETALGFDIEWRPSFARGQQQRPAATLQLAADEFAVVFQLSQIGHLPKPLATLLSRNDVLKVGIGAGGDARKLERDYGGLASRPELLLQAGGIQHAEKISEEHGLFQVRGVLELDALTRYALGMERSRISLSALCEEVLGAHVAKPEAIRMGDWEACPLSEEQLSYAATDAWAGLRCFRKLCSQAPSALADLRDGVARMAAAPQPPQIDDAHEGQESELVPAIASPKLLAPAKYQVFSLFSGGHSINAIADVRGIKPGTVLGYIVEGIVAGYAYDWSRFLVPSSDVLAITEALAKPSATDGIKAIKEMLPDHIEYSTIKLVQAHLNRTRT